jgi:hypothetical protein
MLIFHFIQHFQLGQDQPSGMHVSTFLGREGVQARRAVVELAMANNPKVH